ncbi:glycosyltransferase family 2 protein [Pseudodesulfovibrio pelocollis]|uniref:glycosyltransferase family 2 protein n=1 Tax=Pseudodesulfovibrio pelocollis TaxID=3051432 RepID=UPI00255B2045|nr:glycosyltransferase family 2 protein [Pseudodesulfovibrio sp. SB368]
MQKISKISISIPIYNSEKTIGQLVNRLVEILPAPLEIVLVNDGSRDDSHSVCLSLQKKHPEIVTYVELSKNFGEHCAVMAGLSLTTGDYVVIMDDDFQNPPEEVLKLVDEARTKGHDVVYSSYPVKNDNWFRNLASDINGFMATILLKKPRNLYLSSFKCLNRFLVDEILKYTGPYPYIDGLVFRTTNRYGVVEVQHDKRLDGRSGYTLRKLLSLYLNMFVNFSLLPLRCTTFMGFIVTFFALLFTVYTFISKLIDPDMPAGWATTTILIAFFAGLQLVVLGLTGEYVGRIFLSQNKTPQFCIRKVYKGE